MIPKTPWEVDTRELYRADGVHNVIIDADGLTIVDSLNADLRRLEHDGDDGYRDAGTREAMELMARAPAMRDAIERLFQTPVYEGGEKSNGISVEFLMRLTLARDAAGLAEKDDPFVLEAQGRGA